jgi:hypothetical protein
VTDGEAGQGLAAFARVGGNGRPGCRLPGRRGRAVGIGAFAIVLAAAACSSTSGTSPSGSVTASSTAGSSAGANPAVDQEVAGCPAGGGTLTVDLDEPGARASVAARCGPG